MNTHTPRCVVLSGGVGGAKFTLGISHLLPGPELTVIANVGDDFRHLGLAISPDLDTLMYTLAGQVNPDTGWGCRDESWQCMEMLATLGGSDWFRLGDRDLATHLLRSEALAGGDTLTEITARFCQRLGIGARILPVTDDRLATQVHTDDGVLPFQEYFVRLKAEPVVRRLEFAGADTAKPGPDVLDALADPALDAIVIAPSNPYLSIDPILAVPGLRTALRSASAPVIAITPIVAGRALKGPTAKIMAELGLDVSATTIAGHYREIADGFILDVSDQSLAGPITNTGIELHTCNTVMRTTDDKIRLARETLDFAAELRRAHT